MQYIGRKARSYLQNFTWLGVLLVVMGLIFLGVAVFLQLIPLLPEELSQNGVQQPSTEETVSFLRLTFLLTFGPIGLGLCAGGAISLGRAAARRRKAQQLKAEGACLTAYLTDYAPSAIRVNHRRLACLRCAYDAPDGRTYVFKSGLLRGDPTPFLREGQLRVYYDRSNMSRYFVDVDESAGLGSRVVEL